MSGEYNDAEADEYNDDTDNEDEDADIEESEESEESDGEDITYADVQSLMPKDKQIINIRGEARKTSNELQQTELVYILGLRCAQLERGARAYTDTTNCATTLDIAIKELVERKSIYKIFRVVNETDTTIYREEWRVNEMSVNYTGQHHIFIEDSVLQNAVVEAAEYAEQTSAQATTYQGGRELADHAFPLPKCTIPPLSEWYSPMRVNKYKYVIPELQALKTKLNAAKNKLNPIFADREAWKRYSMITDVVRLYEDLRGSKVLQEKYNAEVVTNAWLKMAEILYRIQAKQPKFYNRDSKFASLHVAEAPGNFILATNHFMRTEYPNVTWDWWANSYYDRENTGRFFGDKYGFIKRYTDRWLLGPRGNGDITAPENIQDFAKRVGKVDLVTSDVKFISPHGVDFDNEENVNFPVHLGHTLIALHCLARGGIAVLKELTYFETTSVNLKQLLAHCFREVEIFKPLTSRPANSEVYIICYDYLDNLHQFYKTKLLDVMRANQEAFTSEPKPAMFLESDIPTPFRKALINAVTTITESQVEEINRNMEMYQKYRDWSEDDIVADMQGERAKAFNNWLAINPLKVLARGDKMLANSLFEKRNGRGNKSDTGRNTYPNTKPHDERRNRDYKYHHGGDDPFQDNPDQEYTTEYTHAPPIVSMDRDVDTPIIYTIPDQR